MSRLIDADALPWQAQTLSKDDEWCLKCADIDAAPTIDPVHAAGGAYCRECKRCEGFPGPDIEPNETGLCHISFMMMQPDDFCSYGEPIKAQNDEKS